MWKMVRGAAMFLISLNVFTLQNVAMGNYGMNKNQIAGMFILTLLYAVCVAISYEMED